MYDLALHVTGCALISLALKFPLSHFDSAAYHFLKFSLLLVETQYEQFTYMSNAA